MGLCKRIRRALGCPASGNVSPLEFVPGGGDVGCAGDAAEGFVVVESAAAAQSDVAGHAGAVETAGTADGGDGVRSVNGADEGGAAADRDLGQVCHAVNGEIGGIGSVVENAA